MPHPGETTLPATDSRLTAICGPGILRGNTVIWDNVRPMPRGVLEADEVRHFLRIARDPYLLRSRRQGGAANKSRICRQALAKSQARSRVTLYIVTELDKQRLQPLVRVLVNMIVRLSATGLSF